MHGADALRFGLLAMSSTQDVRYSDAKVEQGRDLDQQALERQPAHPAERRRGRARAPPAPRRGPLDPLPAGADDRLGHREARGLRLRPRRPGGLLVLLVGALRLVPGDRQAAPLRGRGGGLGDAALGAGAGARPAAPADALRHRGDLVAPPGPRGPPRVHPFPEADESLFDPAAEDDVEGGIALTRRLRAWRDLVEVPVASTLLGPRRRGRAAGVRRPPRPLRVQRRRRRGGRRDRPGQGARLGRDRRRGGRRAAREAARGAARRGRARRAQARQRGLRRQGPAGGGRGGARQARALPRRARGAADRPGGLPRLARADRLEARPRADAHALHAAGNAPAPLRLDPRRRHQRQVLGDADDRGAARGARRRRPAPASRRTPRAGRNGC